ncbi:MAG: IS3 family transposase [Acidobacteria bacterium]|nr:IS3 family transposase [Acidobacteriota bacterium]
MELLRQELAERPTAERALRSLGEAVGLSRSTIRRRLRSAPVTLEQKDLQRRLQIQAIALEMRSYGYRPITKELRRRGVIINSKVVLRLLREDNLLCLRRRAFVATTDSKHRFTVYPNRARELMLTDINQLWVADITYIRLPRAFIYLAAVLDAYSRRCIGWALARYIDARLSLAALKMALQTRSFRPGQLIHHSDQGVQYACYDYVQVLQQHQITISMSRPGTPYDNAKAERFMRTLKYEEVYLNDYDTFAEVLVSVEHFIEAVYNHKRLHSAIGYLPPAEYEASLSPVTLA